MIRPRLLRTGCIGVMLLLLLGGAGGVARAQEAAPPVEPSSSPVPAGEPLPSPPPPQSGGGGGWSSSGIVQGQRTSSRKLVISGSGSLAFRDWSVSGNSPTFQFDTPYNRRLSDQANLFINGPIYGDTFVNASISRSSYYSGNQRWQLVHEGNDARITVGNIDLRFSDNEFIPFSRSLKGLAIETHIGSVNLSAFGSLIKGAVRRESLPGDGTGGPYYIRYRPIVEGSEVVTVDGERLRRGSAETGDYTLDYISGALYFNPPRLVPPTSTISIAYETQVSGQEPGELFGLRADWGIGRLGQMGLSFIGKTGDGSSGGLKTYKEELIANDSTGPYNLLRSPIEPESEAVFVDGQRLQRDLDYRINYQSAVLEFARPVTSSSRIQVTYQYQVPATAGGDRNIIGLDGQFNVLQSDDGRRDLMAQVQFATSAGTSTNPVAGTLSGSTLSGLTSTGQTLGSTSRAFPGFDASGGRGNALKLRLMGRFSDLEMAAEFRNISSDFSRIDSVGYFLNDSGINVNLGYHPFDTLDLFLRFDRFRRPGYSLGSSLQSQSDVGSQYALGVNWAPPGAPQISLLHNIYTNSGGGRSYSMTRDSLGLQYRRGSFNINANLDYSQNSNRGDEVFEGLKASTLASRLSLSYDDYKWFNIRTDLAFSDTSSGTGSTRARSINVGANFTPGSQWTVSTTYQLSRSDGASSYLGYNGTTAASADGNDTSDAGTGSDTEGDQTTTTRQFSGWGSSTGSYGGSYSSSYGSSYGGSYGSSYGGSYGGFGNSSMGGFGSSSSGGNFGSSYGNYSGGSSYGSSYGGYGSGYGGYGGSSGFGGFGGYNPYGTSGSYTTSQTNIETFAIGVDWHPSTRFSINLNFDQQRHDSSFYASPSTSQNWGAGIMLMPWDRISFNSQYSLQKLRYLDDSGGSDSNLFYAGLRGGPFGRFLFNLDYQDLDSASGIAQFGSGGGFGSTLGSTSGGFGSTSGGFGSTSGGFGSTSGGFGTGPTSYQSIQSRNRTFNAGVQYRLSDRNQIFVRWQHSTNSADGASGNFARQLYSLGFDYALTRYLKARISLDRTQYRDPTDSARNYTANMLGAELGANF